MRLFGLAICILSISHVVAQKQVITGQVQDIETGLPIELVHVFVANTTKGTTSDKNGNFTLESLEFGEFDVVASIVGYELFVQRIEITADKTIRIAIKMTPQLVKLDEVEISGKKDRKWERTLKRFTKEFLGTGSNARQCEILNPWVIDFEKDNTTGLNIASSDSYIEVLNNALGYKVFFYIKHFQWKSGFISYFGYPRFEALQAESKQKEKEWELNRKQTYEGSLRHVFSAIVNNQTIEEGFQIYRYNQDVYGQVDNYGMQVNLEDFVGKQLLELDPETIVRQSIDSDHMTIDFYGKLEVIYKVARWDYSPYLDAPYQVSTIQFFLPVRCNSHGYVFDQMNYQVSGYLIFSRIADMLPFEYRWNE